MDDLIIFNAILLLPATSQFLFLCRVNRGSEAPLTLLSAIVAPHWLSSVLLRCPELSKVNDLYITPHQTRFGPPPGASSVVCQSTISIVVVSHFGCQNSYLLRARRVKLLLTERKVDFPIF
uniref:RxLR effector candidate protein n=1 Tax=Hyaloperonospora arabidopsidis (strain Emoy2) TaxID=559515 RepID=M4BEI8_HYAAE